MADYTMLWPLELLAHLDEPDPLPPGTRSVAATPEQVRQALRDLDWPFDESSSEHEGRVTVSFFQAERDGAWPPFVLVDVDVEHLSVRHGGYAAYALAVALNPVCGPLVAWAMSGLGPLVVTPETPYEQFCAVFQYDGDLERDAEWVT